MMNTQVEYFLWDVERYHRAIEAGIFTKSDKIELIEGALFPMPPIGPPHAAVVQVLSDQLREALKSEYTIRVQSPITLPPKSEPEPDIVIAKQRQDAYVQHHPEPQDILVIIEVADSSHHRDKRLKLLTYAQYGIGEYWLILLKTREFYVYADPHEGNYQVRTITPFDAKCIRSHALKKEIIFDMAFL